jgi:hypothetical protein
MVRPSACVSRLRLTPPLVSLLVVWLVRLQRAIFYCCQYNVQPLENRKCRNFIKFHLGTSGCLSENSIITFFNFNTVQSSLCFACKRFSFHHKTLLKQRSKPEDPFPIWFDGLASVYEEQMPCSPYNHMPY